MASEQVEITEEELKKLQEEFEKHVGKIEESWKRPVPVEKKEPTKVIYCVWCYRGDFDGAKVCIERVKPGVDAVCVVGNDLDAIQIEWLRKQGCVFRIQPFNDSFIEQRNTYLQMARELAHEPWVLVSDPDELFNDELVKDLRDVVSALEAQGYNAAGINCIEEFKEADLTDESDLQSYHQIYSGRESNYFKLLLFKDYSDTQYEGVGEMRVLHETWYSPTHATRAVYLDKRYNYRHRKSGFRMWRNSARNVFLAGGGNSVGSVNTAWVQLRRICYRLGITMWEQFEAYMEKGNIAKELLQWILNNMVNNGLDYVSETTQIAKWYFCIHPDEWAKLGKPKVKYEPTERAKVEYGVVRAYLDILGRHPDEGGRRSYTEAILSKRMKLEDLPALLMESTEYRDKFRLPKSAPEKDAEEWVKRCYLNVLGRQADEVGLSAYTQAILTGKIKMEDLPSILKNSKEYQEKFGRP